ncbi:hypothetical protein ADL03_06590 [Nocardia sp. NRRL S-836]|nr:hypothetical protein ADL03_06590 [Nocardia sp. NRRL S-836]
MHSTTIAAAALTNTGSTITRTGRHQLAPSRLLLVRQSSRAMSLTRAERPYLARLVDGSELAPDELQIEHAEHCSRLILVTQAPAAVYPPNSATTSAN